MHRLQAGDGTFDRVLQTFRTINVDGLGQIDLGQLFAYMTCAGGGSSSNSSGGGSGAAAAHRHDGPGGLAAL